MRQKWQITKKVVGPWGNANGPQMHTEVVDSDTMEFHPGHVGFYDEQGMLIRLIRNEDVHDMREASYDVDDTDDD